MAFETLSVEITADLKSRLLAEYAKSANRRTIDELVEDYLELCLSMAELARNGDLDMPPPLTMPLQDWQVHSNPKIGCV